MLTDITFMDWETFDAATGDPEGIDKRDWFDKNISAETWREARIAKGVYYSPFFSNRLRLWGTSHDVVREYVETKSFEDIQNKPMWIGVADNIDQILEHLSQYIKDPDRTFVLSVLRHIRSDLDGRTWRWHKKGPYIGNQNPVAEYFYDEPEIDEVLSYHLVEVKPKKGKQ